jgi:cytochrome c biogenesis protein CcmG/thiol:disulfide interchange protein DsbE
MNKSLLIPLGVFVLLVVFLGLGFQLKDPHLLPSELINKPFPAFSLKDLHRPDLMRSREDLTGEIALVNVWGTWCPNCIIEHPELMRIAREEDVRIFGINYNDETAKAIRWLERREDPYVFSIADDEGRLAIDLGVYGAPETFVIDAAGVIRFRHVGPVTEDIWEATLLPVIELLRAEANG